MRWFVVLIFFEQKISIGMGSIPSSQIGRPQAALLPIHSKITPKKIISILPSTQHINEPTVHLPPAPANKKWYRLVDTALAAPHDFIDNPTQFQPQKVICKMEAHSSIILIAL
jgi:hypothetical protein